MTSLRSLASLPLFGILPDSVVGASSLMGLFSRAAVQTLHRVRAESVQSGAIALERVHRGVRARDARRDPDAVVRRAAHGEARQLGDVLADAGHARVVPHGVLRQPVGPARDAGGDGGGFKAYGRAQVV